MHVLKGQYWLVRGCMLFLRGHDRAYQQRFCLVRIVERAQGRLDGQLDLGGIGNGEKLLSIAEEDLASVMHEQNLVRFETQRLLNAMLYDNHCAAFCQ